MALAAAAGCRQARPLPTRPAPAAAPAIVTPTAAPTLAAELPPRGSPGLERSFVSAALVMASNGPVSAANPAYLEAELAGAGVFQAYFLAGRIEDDGRRRVTLLELLPPAGGGGGPAWGTGVAEAVRTWSAAAWIVGDGTAADGALRRITAGEAERLEVAGRYRSAGAGEYRAVELAFDSASGRLAEVTDSASGEAIQPEPGDEFQLLSLYVGNDGGFSSEPGAALRFTPEASLGITRTVLSPGRAFAGFLAETADGQRDFDLAEFRVADEGVLEGLQLYFEPRHGFQFTYPASWAPISAEAGRWLTAGPNGATHLTLTRLPGSQLDAEGLQAQALTAYGPIQVLYEGRPVVAGAPASLRAYGYDDAGGARTGVLVTFQHGRAGYVLDVDGLQADEAASLEAVDTILSSWRFRPYVQGEAVGDWRSWSGAGLAGAAPSHFSSRAADDGWLHLHSLESAAHLAFASAAESHLPAEAVYSALLASQGRAPARWGASPAYPFELGGATWQRQEFSYQAASGTVFWGLAMSRPEEAGYLYYWAEAPQAAYPELAQTVFPLVAAELRAAPAGSLNPP
ncbi:MAG: hypothetical protein ACRDHL_07895 [Candidatus Promineifilaceae bacterium]